MKSKKLKKVKGGWLIPAGTIKEGDILVFGKTDAIGGRQSDDLPGPNIPRPGEDREK